MKKYIVIFIFMLTMFITACEDGNTSVRVVELSYQSSNVIELTNSNVHRGINLSSVKFSKSKELSSVSTIELEEYIMVGDILTFTVEIEDPNFEFISLLAITFNDAVFRANSDDSIFETRDCGSNICVDFPFEIESGVEEYVLQDLKFVSLNNDTGVSARIDNLSQNALTLDVYEEDIYPYVLKSVENLNNAFSQISLFEVGDVFAGWNSSSQIEAINRRLIIENFNEDLNYSQEIIPNEGEFYSFGNSGTSQQLGVQPSGFDVNGMLVYDSHVYFNLHNIKYSDTYFYNIGNDIYVNIEDKEFFLIQMDKRTYIRSVEESDLVFPESVEFMVEHVAMIIEGTIQDYFQSMFKEDITYNPKIFEFFGGFNVTLTSSHPEIINTSTYEVKYPSTNPVDITIDISVEYNEYSYNISVTFTFGEEI